MMAIDKQNIRHTISPQIHILFVMPRSKKGLGRCHKSGTGNNQGRRRTTPRDNRGFNRSDCHSKSIEMTLPVISVSLLLNNLVINPPQLSLVCQQSSRSSHSSPRDNKCHDRNHNNSKSKVPCLLSEHDHQVILEKLKQEKILTTMNMWKKKITTMLIVMNLIFMTINNCYFIFNIL